MMRSIAAPSSAWVSLLRVPSEDPLARALRCSGVNVDDDQVVDLLIDLQDIHDLAAIESWPAALEDIRRRLPATPLAA